MPPRKVDPSDELAFVKACFKHFKEPMNKANFNFDEVAKETGTKDAQAAYQRFWAIKQKWGMAGSKGTGTGGTTPKKSPTKSPGGTKRAANGKAKAKAKGDDDGDSPAGSAGDGSNTGSMDANVDSGSDAETEVAEDTKAKKAKGADDEA